MPGVIFMFFAFMRLWRFESSKRTRKTRTTLDTHLCKLVLLAFISAPLTPFYKQCLVQTTVPFSGQVPQNLTGWSPKQDCTLHQKG